ncbi:4-hydroxyphenylacetate catabolism regulatory protein HpaA [Geomonas silvestris]|uniref:4-hydroxyphenylacetate catabolism regulatory protein HpaA n=1 Tax=Geomonas silvestris TaxID=2740184 RepID=A0A6V8MN04_9BACT|nr:helix-turn-helix transcriptional regulator [Geomonas silvestris]GFO61039.1 4-hydroxyphenylacetate catabolism regulatory protein HpaA [Geomonas silvestris]
MTPYPTEPKSSEPGCHFDRIPAQLAYLELDHELAARLTRQGEMPHRHAYQEIIWIRDGAVRHLLDSDSIEYPAPTILIIPKGRIHSLVPTPACRGAAIRFTEEFLGLSSHLLFSQFMDHTALRLTAEQADWVARYLSLLAHECRQADPFNLHAARHLLSALIAKLEELRLTAAHLVPHDVNSTLCLWNRFNTEIERHFKAEHTVAYYATALGISPRKLGEVVKLYTGKHVSIVIDDRLITEAKRLILFSELSIKEIAFELGFEEHSYFSKVFKKVTGLTPSEFKQRRTAA